MLGALLRLMKEAPTKDAVHETFKHEITCTLHGWLPDVTQTSYRSRSYPQCPKKLPVASFVAIVDFWVLLGDDNHEFNKVSPHRNEALYILQSLSLEERYVKLNPEDLELVSTFSEHSPDLSTDFRVSRLLPIVRGPSEQGDVLIIKDVEGTYYMWDEWDGHLFKIKDEWITWPGLTTAETIVDNILCTEYSVSKMRSESTKNSTSGGGVFENV